MNKDEKILWTIVRGGLLIIALFFIAKGFIWKPECDIDKIYLACRLTGSFGDWLGVTLFLGGLVFMSGIIKGFSNLSSPPNSTMWNWITFAATVLGAVLFWNL